MKARLPRAHAKRLPRAKSAARPKATARPDFARAVRLADTDCTAALAQAKSAFGREGFGVAAEIDFRDALEAKLDKDIGPLWMVEVWNPNLADRALAIDRTAFLLMPCKVAVWQEGKDAVVASTRPGAEDSCARHRPRCGPRGEPWASSLPRQPQARYRRGAAPRRVAQRLI
jgi:hypothetical protein